MQVNREWIVFCLFSAVVLVGCSGAGSPGGPSGGGSAPVSVTITDTPPAGVTVLSFEVTVIGAVLRSNTGQPDVVLVSNSNPIEIELKHLETETAFLSTVNVPADTYNDIVLTLSNLEFTIQNNTGGTISFAGLNCPNGAVCEFQPAVAGSVTFSGPPFPLTITANSPTGLLVDVNLNAILTDPLGVNLSASGGVTVSQLPLPGQPTGQLEEIEDLVGVVKNKDASRFTLQTPHGDFVVTVNSNTDFDDFAACSADNFTCVLNDQVVEVDLILLAGGGFLAEEVELEDDAIDDELDGIVFAIDNAAQFKIVVVEELRNLAGVDVGNPVTVTLQLGANLKFEVDENGLTVPANLLSGFEGASDTSALLPGQRVQVRVRSLVAGATTISVSTDRVRLRMSRFTAQVSGPPSGSFFNVSNLPSLFTSASPPILQIQVQTSPSETDFEGVNDINGLADGNIVSLRGLLFKATPTMLIADKVRKR